ncbi:MAG: hypothetical protein O8C62_03025 [Candidatus Methanoperedens sp.]|nr:hypothetical protein [Candidatus Methanoperedens sp.]
MPGISAKSVKKAARLAGADLAGIATIQIAIFTSIFAAGMIASSLMLHYSTESFFTKAAQLREDLD